MGVALEARELARAAKAEIDGHEAVCAERYENINQKLGPDGDIRRQLGMMWKIFGFAGSTGFLIVMGMLAYLMKSNDESMHDLQKTVTEMRATPPSPPQIIIQPPAGSQPMGATVDPAKR